MFVNNWFQDRYSIASPPVEAVQDCSGQGDVSEAVEYWVSKLKFEGPAWLIREHLSGYGAWDTQELCDHNENLLRLFWLWCCDIEESCHELTQECVDINSLLYLAR